MATKKKILNSRTLVVSTCMHLFSLLTPLASVKLSVHIFALLLHIFKKQSL